MLEHSLLEGDGSFGLGFPIGANGIAFRHGSLYLSNTERGRIIRVPINQDGSAGAPEPLREEPALIGADGLALDVLGNI